MVKRKRRREWLEDKVKAVKTGRKRRDGKKEEEGRF